MACCCVVQVALCGQCIVEVAWSKLVSVLFSIVLRPLSYSCVYLPSHSDVHDIPTTWDEDGWVGGALKQVELLATGLCLGSGTTVACVSSLFPSIFPYPQINPSILFALSVFQFSWLSGNNGVDTMNLCYCCRMYLSIYYSIWIIMVNSHFARKGYYLLTWY